VSVPALSLVSLCILVYDHFDRTNLLALGLATASIVAMVVRSVPDASRAPRQPRHEPPPGAYALRAA
jgi:hypothetical protein